MTLSLLGVEMWLLHAHVEISYLVCAWKSGARQPEAKMTVHIKFVKLRMAVS